METTIQVRHAVVEIKIGYENFTRNFERLLGRSDPAMLADLDSAPGEVQKRLEGAAGEEGLMLFNIQEHGKLLNIFGAPRKAKQYVLGNPLTAITMTRHDIRAALYAPLRVLVYEGDNGAARIEFDQPSSLFGQFGQPEVTAVGQELERKLASLIQKADRGAEVAQSGR